jgi:hypothetical protein
METLKAVMMGQCNSGNPLMVFDWDKAAQLIKDQQPAEAGAGLRSDWEWTGGTIFAKGEPVTDSYTYLTSTWAVPELSLDDVVVECYRLKSEAPGWDSATKWPESALRILKGDTEAKHAKG